MLFSPYRSDRSLPRADLSPGEGHCVNWECCFLHTEVIGLYWERISRLEKDIVLIESVVFSIQKWSVSTESGSLAWRRTLCWLRVLFSPYRSDRSLLRADLSPGEGHCVNWECCFLHTEVIGLYRERISRLEKDIVLIESVVFSIQKWSVSTESGSLAWRRTLCWLRVLFSPYRSDRSLPRADLSPGEGHCVNWECCFLHTEVIGLYWERISRLEKDIVLIESVVFSIQKWSVSTESGSLAWRRTLC